MKFVPNAIARKVAQQGHLASKHSPSLLFGAGVVGMVGSTVLACRATLRVSDILDQIDHDKGAHYIAKEQVDTGRAAEGVTYSDKEFKKDITIIQVQGLGKVVKLYAPAVILGGVSIACLTKSHNILQDRNAALLAAYTAVDTAYKNYRERVIEKYGEEEDRNFRFASEEVDVVDEETGKVVTTVRATDIPGAPYARWFASWSSDNWNRAPELNLLFLKSQQNWANDRLRARGHLFLNEVYEALGLSHTEAGAVVGWRFNKGSGDDKVDFGCWNGTDEANDFFWGDADEVLLDFNVDGMIYKLIEEDR